MAGLDPLLSGKLFATAKFVCKIRLQNSSTIGQRPLKTVMTGLDPVIHAAKLRGCLQTDTKWSRVAGRVKPGYTEWA